MEKINTKATPEVNILPLLFLLRLCQRSNNYLDYHMKDVDDSRSTTTQLYFYDNRTLSAETMFYAIDDWLTQLDFAEWEDKYNEVKGKRK